MMLLFGIILMIVALVGGLGILDLILWLIGFFIVLHSEKSFSEMRAKLTRGLK